jgi:hypothetical protein
MDVINQLAGHAGRTRRNQRPSGSSHLAKIANRCDLTTWRFHRPMRSAIRIGTLSVMRNRTQSRRRVRAIHLRKTDIEQRQIQISSSVRFLRQSSTTPDVRTGTATRCRTTGRASRMLRLCRGGLSRTSGRRPSPDAGWRAMARQHALNDDARCIHHINTFLTTWAIAVWPVRHDSGRPSYCSDSVRPFPGIGKHVPGGVETAIRRTCRAILPNTRATSERKMAKYARVNPMRNN